MLIHSFWARKQCSAAFLLKNLFHILCKCLVFLREIMRYIWHEFPRHFNELRKVRLNSVRSEQITERSTTVKSRFQIVSLPSVRREMPAKMRMRMIITQSRTNRLLTFTLCVRKIQGHNAKDRRVFGSLFGNVNRLGIRENTSPNTNSSFELVFNCSCEMSLSWTICPFYASFFYFKVRCFICRSRWFPFSWPLNAIESFDFRLTQRTSARSNWLKTIFSNEARVTRGWRVTCTLAFQWWTTRKCCT
jgi:hypothetical protein